MLTIARTLMANPQFLLLDEPGEGLATAVSDRAYVMDKGTIRYQGTMGELRGNEEVRRKYLMV